MEPIRGLLNHLALLQANSLITEASKLRVEVREAPGGGTLVDCGIEVPGGIEAGLGLARTCLAGLADVSVVPGEVRGTPLPAIQVFTDHPVAACLASQYAGWAIQREDFFAMGSGPMRAAYGGEELYESIGFRESPECAVGVLESRKLPSKEVFDFIASKTGVDRRKVTLLVAPTASLAGGIQVVARSVETALHKLHALEFDLSRIESGWGTALLPPVAKNDLEAMGRTNDCVLYGGRAILYVRGDDSSLSAIGPKVPSSASPDHGAPFLEIFERYNRDFYKMDPHLFSPAEVIFQNVDTGTTRRFGQLEPEILAKSLFE